MDGDGEKCSGVGRGIKQTVYKHDAVASYGRVKIIKVQLSSVPKHFGFANAKRVGYVAIYSFVGSFFAGG